MWILLLLMRTMGGGLILHFGKCNFSYGYTHQRKIEDSQYWLAKVGRCPGKDSRAPTDSRQVFADYSQWIGLLAATCYGLQTSGDLEREAGNRKKLQMERLPKENYYGHFGNFGSDQKARLSSLSSGSGFVTAASSLWQMTCFR